MKINDRTYSQIVDLVTDVFRHTSSEKIFELQKRWDEYQEGLRKDGAVSLPRLDMEDAVCRYLFDIGWPGSKLTINDIETILFT